MKSQSLDGVEAGSSDYADADTLPTVDFALPLALFWFADVIHSSIGEATKIVL